MISLPNIPKYFDCRMVSFKKFLMWLFLCAMAAVIYIPIIITVVYNEYEHGFFDMPTISTVWCGGYLYPLFNILSTISSASGLPMVLASVYAIEESNDSYLIFLKYEIVCLLF